MISDVMNRKMTFLFKKWCCIILYGFCTANIKSMLRLYEYKKLCAETRSLRVLNKYCDVYACFVRIIFVYM